MAESCVNAVGTAESRGAREPLGGSFDYLIGYDHGAPSPEYYWYRKRQRVLRLIERHFPGASWFDVFPGWRAVELGCGDGVDFFLLRKKILELSRGASLRFIGAEGNPDALRMCRLKQVYYQASDSDFVWCDLSQSSLPFGDREFDFVYCSEVLEHLRRPETLLEEVKRILKPQGYFLMTTPNEPNLFQRSYWGRERRRKHMEEALKNPAHVVGPDSGKALPLFGHVSVRRFSEWETCLAEIGFERVDFERGALVYSLPRLLSGDFLTGLRFCLEGALDALPKSWVRGLSDQVIGLYRIRDS